MSDIHNENVHINTQINNPVLFGNVFYAKDPNREFLSVREPQMLNAFLDRTDFLNQIREQFLTGKNIVVIIGESGLGKSALANAYYHHFKNEYDQRGWVNYNLNICKSIVQSFDSHNTEINGRKNDDLYSQLAASEIIYLRNNPHKRLIVVKDISNWQDIQNYLDFFQLEHTHFLFTASSSFGAKHLNFSALQVENLLVPRIANAEVKSLFEKYCHASIAPPFVQQLNTNLFLIQLIIRQTPKENPRVIQSYFESIFEEADSENAILLKVLNKSNLSTVEIWTLLQIAILPENNYDTEDLAEFLLADNVDNILDISDLKGFQSFKSQYTDFPTSTALTLEDIIPKLIDRGWLIKLEDAQFRMHGLVRTTLKNRINLDSDYFYEISNSLSIAFYTEFSGLVLDDLKYETHLRSFLSFLPEQAKELYLQNLWKLIVLVRRNGNYYQELELREKHLLLLRKSSHSGNSHLVQTLTDISDCQRRCGNLEAAKNTAKESLKIATSISGRSLGSSQTALALALKDLGEYTSAKELLEKAMLSNEKNYGPEHPNTAVGYSNLALVLHRLGEYTPAKELLEKAILLDQKIFGPQHPITAVSYSNLALVLIELEKYSLAKELMEKAVQSAENNFGVEHPITVGRYSNLATILKYLGKKNTAKRLLEKVMQSNAKNFGPEHPNTVLSYSNLAIVLIDLEEYIMAKELLEKAMLFNENNFGSEHPNTAVSYSNLAVVLATLGELEAAIKYSSTSVRILETVLPEGHPYIKDARAVLQSIKSNQEKK